MNIRFALPVVLIMAVVPFASTVQAQVPSSAEPSRVQEQISPLDKHVITSQGTTRVSDSKPLTAPPGSEKVKFVLKTVKIDGSSVYSDSEIRSIYGDKVGQEISLAEVYGMAQALTVKYRNDGYILTQAVVPDQTIDGGNIRLRVVEGYVDQVLIEGGARDSRGYLQGFAENLRAERPLNAAKLERYVLLMNDVAGVSAQAILSPSATKVGATDVTFVIDDTKKYDAFAQLDNRGSRYLGPLQMNIGARLNNLFGLNEGVSIQAVTALTDLNDRELDYLAASWSQPLNHEGTKLTIGGNISSTEPGFSLTATQVEGLAKSFNAELSHPFIRSRNQNLFGAVRFDFLNSRRSDNLGLGDTVDRLRVLRASGTYQFTDALVGINTLNVGVSKGLGILGASDEGDANMTRALGDPDFFKTTFELSRLQRVTNIFDIFATISGQSTSNTLLASEEFGVGGVNYGSAYDSSEITGEDGLAGRIELRANNPVESPADTLQLYSFYDVGKVWDADNVTPKDRIRSVASAGAGVRASINSNFAATFEVAVPLTRQVATQGDNDPRFFGSVTSKF